MPRPNTRNEGALVARSAILRKIASMKREYSVPAVHPQAQNAFNGAIGALRHLRDFIKTMPGRANAKPGGLGKR